MSSEENRARADFLTTAGKEAYRTGDYGAARQFHQQSLVLRRDLGDTKGSAAALNNMGNAALNAGDYGAAQAFHEQSFALKKSIGDTRSMAGSLNNLGMVAYRQKNYTEAGRYFHESLILYREVGETSHILNPLENCAYVLLEQGDARKAVVLWGAADALRKSMDASLPPLDKAEMEAGIEMARQLLAVEETVGAFSSAWEQGRLFNVEQAAAFALSPPA